MSNLPPRPEEYVAPRWRHDDNDRRRSPAPSNDHHRRDRIYDRDYDSYSSRRSPPRQSRGDSYVAGTNSYGECLSRDGRYADAPRDRYRDRDSWNRDARDYDRRRGRESYQAHERDRDVPRDRVWEARDSRGWSPPRRAENDHDFRRSPPPGRRGAPSPARSSRRSPAPIDSYVPRRSRSPDKPQRGEPSAVERLHASRSPTPRSARRSRRDCEAPRDLDGHHGTSRPRDGEMGTRDEPAGRAGEETKCRSASRTRRPTSAMKSFEEASPPPLNLQTNFAMDRPSGAVSVEGPGRLEPKVERNLTPSITQSHAPAPGCGPTRAESPPELGTSQTKSPGSPLAGHRIPTGPRSAVPPPPPARLPAIPTWKPKPSLTADLDAELSRLQTHRASLQPECSRNAAILRRSIHEGELAALDLQAAEQKRRLCDLQLEQARAGMLGIDAEVPVVQSPNGAISAIG